MGEPVTATATVGLLFGAFAGWVAYQRGLAVGRDLGRAAAVRSMLQEESRQRAALSATFAANRGKDSDG